jgi:hypothetical protein
LYMLINMYIKYKIWKYKLANAKPRVNSILQDVCEWICRLTWHKKWKNMLPICRQHVLG